MPTHTTIYGSLDFVQDNLGEPVPGETFTHSHLLWSPVIPYLLSPSITIHGILPVQFMCLTVFFPQSLQVYFGLPKWQLPLHTSHISSPNHCRLFAAIAHTIATSFAVIPRLCHLILVSLSTLNLENTHTHNRFMALWILSGKTLVSQYQKKHSPTYTYHGHQSSLICFIHLI